MIDTTIGLATMIGPIPQLESFGDDDFEGFFSDIGKLAKNVSRTVKKGARGVAKATRPIVKVVTSKEFAIASGAAISIVCPAAAPAIGAAIVAAQMVKSLDSQDPGEKKAAAKVIGATLAMAKKDPKNFKRAGAMVKRIHAERERAKEVAVRTAPSRKVIAKRIGRPLSAPRRYVVTPEGHPVRVF